MPDRNELRRLLLFAVAVLVLFFIARIYAPALDGVFIWDDHSLVESNAAFRHAPLAKLFTRPFWSDSPLNDAVAPYYRPIVMLSYRFDIALGGTPREFHFTNVALHMATCLLLGIVAVRAGASYPAALIASLVWAALPRLTEAVVWIAGRTDVLAAFFGFAALAIWPEVGPPPWRHTWARSLLAGVLLFLSLASKEVGIAFSIAALVAVALRGGTRGTLARAGVGIGAPLIVYFALRAGAFATVEFPATRDLGAGARIATIFEAAGRYAEMTVDPFHSRTSIGFIGEPDTARVVAGVFVIAAALVGGVFVVRRGSFGARIGVVLGAAAILPVLHVIPLSLASAVVADRLLYVPLAALALGAAVALTDGGRRVRIAAALAVVLTITLGAVTHARASDYREETHFWVTAAEGAHPHNTAPRMGLAKWLMDSIEVEAACPLYERSLAILSAQGLSSRPPHRRARESLAACWGRLGRYDDALVASRELAHDFPDRARIALALGLAELHVRDFDAAAASFARAASLENGALASRLVPPERLISLRRDEAHFDQLSTHAKGEHLAALGRAPEASKAFLAAAADATMSYARRYDAVAYLIRYGDYPDTELGLQHTAHLSFEWDSDVWAYWKRRQRVRRAVIALTPRIHALTR